MKVILALANASAVDKFGTVSCLGLGITRLHLGDPEREFSGALLVLVEGAEGPNPTEFTISVDPPEGPTTEFANGRVTVNPKGPQSKVGDLSVAAQSFKMVIPKDGEYVFRVNCNGEEVAHTHILVTSGGPPPWSAQP